MVSARPCRTIAIMAVRAIRAVGANGSEERRVVAKSAFFTDKTNSHKNPAKPKDPVWSQKARKRLCG